MNKQNIAVLTSSYPKRKGDSNGNFVHELNKELVKYCDVYVICPWEKDLHKEEVMDGIKIYRHKQFIWNVNFAYGTDIMDKIQKNPLLYFVVPIFFIYQVRALHKIIKKENIHIIHAHWLIPSALVAAVYKKLTNKKIKIVATLLGADVWSFNKGWRKKILQFALSQIDLITAQSKPLFDEVLKNGYSRKGLVLPVGIDTTKFSPELASMEIKTRYNIEGPLLLFVGSLISRKGVIPLVNAISRLTDKHKEIKLLMVGEGYLKNEVVELIQQLHLENHIHLIGSLPNDELPPYFAIADIFVLPSLSEGFPLVVMEALSSGTVPVVSDLSVFTEHTHRDELFSIAKADNVESLVDVLNNLLSNIGELNSKKQKLREFAVENMDNKRIAERYSQIYGTL
jgi:glycosyltransferase involved in cell wall biosynthesis